MWLVRPLSFEIIEYDGRASELSWKNDLRHIFFGNTTYFEKKFSRSIKLAWIYFRRLLMFAYAFAGFLVITKLVRYTFSMNGAAAIATTFHWNENSSSKINFNDIIT